MRKANKIYSLLLSVVMLVALTAACDDSNCNVTIVGVKGDPITFVDSTGNSYTTTFPDSGEITVPCSANLSVAGKDGKLSPLTPSPPE
jgi:hypothetical protein